MKFIEDTREIKELKVNMNYQTGSMGSNNCRIVPAGSELDRMYAQTYHKYLVKTRNKTMKKESK